MPSIIEWINELCPKLQDLIQRRFKKSYIYNFNLASEATQNSNLMLDKQTTSNFYPMNGASAEVIASVQFSPDENSALERIVDFWEKTPKHRSALVNYNDIGIGFAFDIGRNVLYATARLC